MTGSGPWDALANFRVLEIGQNVAGPYSSQVLSHFGAEVIKIEPPTGDATRLMSVPKGRDDATFGPVFATFNHGKKLLGLDLKHPNSRSVVERLVAASDVVIQTLRPGVADKLGVGKEAIHAINPRAIHCSVVAFYHEDGGRPGYDVLAQAESGIMARTGEPDRPLSRVPISAIDYHTGLWVAASVMAALHGARDRVAFQISLIDIAMSLQSETAAVYLADGTVPQRRGSSMEIVAPHRAFATEDGEILVSAGTDVLFRRLVELLGPPLDDERFARLPGRLAHRDELDAAIAERLKTAPSSEWIARMDGLGIPVASIRTLDDAVARHQQLSSTGVVEVGEYSLVAPPVEANPRWKPQPHDLGPIGKDTSDVLTQLGFTATEIDQLRQQGVVC